MKKMDLKIQKYGLNITLIEFLEHGEGAIPLYETHEICCGIEDIIPTLNSYSKKMEEFIEKKLKWFDY